MIPATRAKEIYDGTGVEMQTYLTTTVEPQVIDAAEKGKKELTIHLGCEPTYLAPKPTNLQNAAVAELKRLGYSAEIRSYGAPYVPRGLADDNGNGPQHRNYGLVIGWV